MIKRIISGGQTGADQGALAAGAALGLKTGGWMPRGYRTEAGPNPALAALYGLWEHASDTYPPRTLANVRMGSATLIFGYPRSAGCLLTDRYCRELGRQFYVQEWPIIVNNHVDRFQLWLDNVHPETLNVAGNREESNPGIHDACRDFLIAALRTRPSPS